MLVRDARKTSGDGDDVADNEDGQATSSWSVPDRRLTQASAGKGKSVVYGGVAKKRASARKGKKVEAVNKEVDEGDL